MAHGENARLALEIGVPAASVLLGAYAAYAKPLAALIEAKTHSARLANAAIAAGAVAGQIADVLATLPANVDAKALKSSLVTLAATNLEPAAAGALGAVNPAVVSLVTAELAKLPAQATRPVAAVLSGTPPG